MKTKLVLCGISVASLTACGGGGGGGLSSTLTPLSRTTVQYAGGQVSSPSTIYNAPTLQQEFTYSYSLNPATDDLSISSVVVNTNPTAGQFSVGLDQNSNLDYLRVVSGSSNTDFSVNTAAGGEIDTTALGQGSISAGYTADGSSGVYFLAPDNFDYQTFGFWLSNRIDGSGAGGAFTAGGVTPATNLPASGVFSYSGLSTGFYIAGDGTPYVTASRVSLTAFFDTIGIGGIPRTPSVSFYSYDTRGQNVNTGATVNLLEATLLGDFTINNPSSTFSGSVDYNGLTGTASGRFYGPLYEEAGGVFRVSGGSVRYIGSFGTSR